ncbi:MAG TPA: hypothetical protein VIY48_21320 [Candidatus Paceibacterota bacterium]
MPPSGFSENHTRELSSFLSGCLKDLIEENRGVRTAHQAVAREIRHIDTDLAKNARSPAATATLQLVRAFYGKMLAKIPENEKDFGHLHTAGTLAAREVMDEVEAIHVVEDDSPPAKITDTGYIGADRHREL